MFWFLPQSNYYIYICSFWVPDYESKVPAGYVSTNFGLLDKIDLSLITLRSLKVEYIWVAISAAIFFVIRYRRNFDGSESNLFHLVPWYTDISILRAWCRPNMDKIWVLFFHPGWVGLNTYIKITNEFPPLNYFNG